MLCVCWCSFLHLIATDVLRPCACCSTDCGVVDQYYEVQVVVSGDLVQVNFFFASPPATQRDSGTVIK